MGCDTQQHPKDGLVAIAPSRIVSLKEKEKKFYTVRRHNGSL